MATISVIVTVYNIAPYLERCIESILNQSMADFELILVDDGSTDSCPYICDVYERKDSRVRVIHKKNRGLVSARKAGVQAANGAYICYVDGDDWICPDMLEQLFTDALNTGADLVVSNYFFDLGNSTREVKSICHQGLYNAEDIIPMMLYTGNFYEFGISPFVWAKLFRKDRILNVQMGVDDRICCGEDVAVTYPYILKINKVYISDYSGYHYVQRMGSMTSSYDSKEVVRNQILLRHLLNIFGQSEFSQSLYVQLNQYAKNLLLVRQIAYFDSCQNKEILLPYGGLPKNSRIILYGAGKLGQSIYHYLRSQLLMEVIVWVDKNYAVYQDRGHNVECVERLKDIKSDSYDYVIIAINNQKTIACVRDCLAKEYCVEKEKVKWLSEAFVSEKNDVVKEMK